MMLKSRLQQLHTVLTMFTALKILAVLLALTGLGVVLVGVMAQEIDFQIAILALVTFTLGAAHIVNTVTE